MCYWLLTVAQFRHLLLASNVRIEKGIEISDWIYALPFEIRGLLVSIRYYREECNYLSGIVIDEMRNPQLVYEECRLNINPIYSTFTYSSSFSSFSKCYKNLDLHLNHCVLNFVLNVSI